MATYGFTESLKNSIAAKLQQLDEKIAAARAAINSGEYSDAALRLREFHEMKIGELITSFPDIRLAERHHGLPFAVLYEDFSGIMETVNEFLRWLGRELRKPPAERRFDAREHYLNLLKEFYESLRWVRSLPWPESVTADALEEALLALRRIMERVRTLDEHTANGTLVDEADLIPFSNCVHELLRLLSDAGFSLQAAYDMLRGMDGRAALVHDRMNTIGNIPFDIAIAKLDLDAIESQKHELGELVQNAPVN